MTTQSSINEVRELNESEIADVAGGKDIVCKDKVVFDIGWLKMHLYECDDGSYDYGYTL